MARTRDRQIRITILTHWFGRQSRCLPYLTRFNFWFPLSTLHKYSEQQQEPIATTRKLQNEMFHSAAGKHRVQNHLWTSCCWTTQPSTSLRPVLTTTCIWANAAVPLYGTNTSALHPSSMSAGPDVRWIHSASAISWTGWFPCGWCKTITNAGGLCGTVMWQAKGWQRVTFW